MPSPPGLLPTAPQWHPEVSLLLSFLTLYKLMQRFCRPIIPKDLLRYLAVQKWLKRHKHFEPVVSGLWRGCLTVILPGKQTCRGCTCCAGSPKAALPTQVVASKISPYPEIMTEQCVWKYIILILKPIQVDTIRKARLCWTPCIYFIV